jgi:hypothetical protein
MNRRPLKLVLLVLLACAASQLWAQDGLQGAVARDNTARSFATNYATFLERRLVTADFDGDQKPDGAVLLHPVPLQDRKSFRVEVHLSASNNTELRFESTEDGLSIEALDINHDGATDLVVEQALTHRRLYVWLGDGRGGFRQGRVDDFPASGTTTGHEVDSTTPQQQYAVLSLPSENRWQVTLLRASRVWGRPPSAEELYIAPAVSSRSLLIAVVLAARAPPPFQAL